MSKSQHPFEPTAEQQQFIPTAEQQQFIDYVRKACARNDGRWVRIVLNASGGTGKTATIRYLVNEVLPDAQVLAPTNKACSLFKKEGIHAITVHRFLNAKQEIDDDTGEVWFTFDHKKTDQNKTHVLIVDECSMVGSDMFDVLMSLDCHIIFTGDEFQLPPVGEGVSQTFKLSDKFTFTVNMRVEKRHRDSISAKTVVCFRKCVTLGKRLKVDKQDKEFMLSTFSDNINCVALTWTNARVKFLNDLIRRRIYAPNVLPEEPLDKFYPDETLVFSGFRFANGRKFYSSDSVEVCKLQDTNEFVPFPVCDHVKAKMGKTGTIPTCKKCGIKKRSDMGVRLDFFKITDEYNTVWYQVKEHHQKELNAILADYRDHCKIVKNKEVWKRYYDLLNEFNADLKYRHAMTVHKAQGSQWDNVFVDIDNIRRNQNEVEEPRMAYTAVSRFQQFVYFI